MASSPKIIVLIPTYNEAENIGPVVTALLAQPYELEVVVVDDDSPDGTAGVVRELASRAGRVRLLLRSGPRGRGLAGREGFLWALSRGADYILEMDGDGSHDPRELPRFLEAAPAADVVIGSRFLTGGKAVGRGNLRAAVSFLARMYLRLVLRIGVSDPTSGYRLFSRSALQAIEPETLRATDPFTVTEVLYRCHLKRLRITEVPIVFRDRERGESKLRTPILFAYFFRVLKLALAR